MNNLDLSKLKSPIIIEGDSRYAYRDPAVVFHDGVFYLYFTVVIFEDDQFYARLGLMTSRDLINWSDIEYLSPLDPEINLCGPGNIIRFEDQWIICASLYPTPEKGRYGGNENSRATILRSDDLRHWSDPEVLQLREHMGRTIDPFLVEDLNEKGKWWCLYKFQFTGVSYSSSRDLRNWRYEGIVKGQHFENACAIRKDNYIYLMYSPENGMEIKRTRDMESWEDVAQTTLGQEDWPWSQRRITAGFILEMDLPNLPRYLMFFHGSRHCATPATHSMANLALCWSDDLLNWHWPD